MTRKPNTHPTTPVTIKPTGHPKIRIDCLDTGTLTPTLRIRQGDHQIALTYDQLPNLTTGIAKAHQIYKQERPGTEYPQP